MSVAHAPEHLLEDWVPVERRWLGIDKRTIPPAVVSFLLIAVFVVVLPSIDRALDYDRQIKAGDIVDLGDGMTFVPATGWNFPDGLLTSQDSTSGAERVINLNAKLENAGVTFAVTTGPFTGTPDQLLDQIHSINKVYKSIDNSKYTSDRVTATTSREDTGVAQGFVGVNVEGILAAFVINGIGVEIVVSGPPGSLDQYSDEIGDMIDSLNYTAPEAS
jgi:hypothetical protein